MIKANRAAIALCMALLALGAVSCASMRVTNHNDREIIVRFARNMLNKKYAYGQNDPSSGFDCSGLVFYAFKEAGIKIPRTAAEQFKNARKIGLDEAKEGDLVFFSTSGPGATHVGIYIGDGKFIHSPSEGKKVRIVDMYNPYWKENYYGTATYFAP